MRACVRGDAAELVALHRRTLLGPGGASPDVLRFVEDFYGSVLFDNPWADPELPSLVHEGADGRIAAFVGVLPRPMQLHDRPVRAAVITRVMADPDHPEGAIGVAALFRHALRGPQDLSFADVVNEPGRRLWEAQRGVVVMAGSVWWTAPTPGDARPDAGAQVRDLKPAELRAAIEAAARRYVLRPVYDDRSVEWLVGHLDAATHRGELHVQGVEGDDGAPAGWYVGYRNDAGWHGVQQVGVVGGRGDAVLDAVVGRLAAGGTAPVRGRAEVGLLPFVQARGCTLDVGPWTCAHSRQDDVLLALTAGRAFLTRLEGEY